MDLVVGSWETIVIDVAPYDGSTAATLTILSPDSPTPTPVTLGSGTPAVADDGTPVLRFTSPTPIQYIADGWWVLDGTITGVGATPVYRRFFVAPAPVASSGPVWTPTLERVGTYIPERTVEIDRLSDGKPALSFTDDTRPTATQISSQIEGACAWVLLGTTDSLDSSLFDAARELAAIRAAGLAEIAWPVRDGDINAGQALLTQADAGLKSLIARNDAITGELPEVFEVAPVWSFPAPDPYGDYDLS